MAAKQGKEKGSKEKKSSTSSAESKKKSTSGKVKEIESDRDFESTAIASNEIEVDEEIDGETINKLLELFSEDELAAVDVNLSIDMLDIWYDALRHSGEPGLNDISKLIARLKKQIGDSKSSPEEIGELLSQLGQQVDDYANDAPSHKTKLHQLGKAIKKAGRHTIQEQSKEVEEE